MKRFFRAYQSPVGLLKLVACEDGLSAILWENEREGRVKMGELIQDDSHEVLLATAQQLDEYFAQSRECFELSLHFEGTDFQKRVWQQLLQIPYGQTRTYSEIAASLNEPRSVRAVGTAIGKNPIGIVIPCHRVVGVKGDLTGFAGGVEVKGQLLDLERGGKLASR